METAESGLPNSPDSLGGAQARGASSRRNRRHTAIAAAVIVWAGVLVGILPNLFVGVGFFGMTWTGCSRTNSPHHHRQMTSLVEMAQDGGIAWMLGIAATIATPLWFWRWRSAGGRLGAAIGVLGSMLGAAAIRLSASEYWMGGLDAVEFEFSGTYPTLIAADVAFAVAFLLVPRPDVD